jgi:Zn-dependent M28 family amino/carboxypeptidase
VIEASGPHNRPRVRLVVRGELDEIDSQNVMGTLRGTGDEYIIVTAHVDGFWNACVDNGGGVAGLLELARFYSTVPLRQRPYNLLFLVTGDHEVLATTGAHRFAQVYREIIDGTVAVFQLEHMASTAITNEVGIYLETNSANSNGLFVTNMSPLLLELFGEATDRYGIVSHRRTYPNYWGDVVGFADTGVTCAGWISSAFYYHSTLDGLHIVTPQGLERFTRAYAYVIDGTMKASREDIEREASPPSADFYSSEMMATVQSMW